MKNRLLKKKDHHIISSHSKIKATKLVLQIEEDLSHVGFISPKRLKRLNDKNIHISSVTNTFGTNLIGSCYSPLSVKHLLDLGCTLTDPTGKIGLWCDDTVLIYCVNKDMDFKPSLRLIQQRLLECNDDAVRRQLEERRDLVDALCSSRKNSIHNLLVEWSYHDISICILTYF